MFSDKAAFWVYLLCLFLSFGPLLPASHGRHMTVRPTYLALHYNERIQFNIGIQKNSPKSWDAGSKVNKNRVLWSFTGTETNHRGKWNVVQSHSGAFLSCQRSRANIICRRADTLSQTPAASLAWPVNLTPCMALDCWRKYPIKCVILRTICAHLELMSAKRLYEVGPCFLFSFNNSP